jgi:hypothetical protein
MISPIDITLFQTIERKLFFKPIRLVFMNNCTAAYKAHPAEVSQCSVSLSHKYVCFMCTATMLHDVKLQGCDTWNIAIYISGQLGEFDAKIKITGKTNAQKHEA